MALKNVFFVEFTKNYKTGAEDLFDSYTSKICSRTCNVTRLIHIVLGKVAMIYLTHCLLEKQGTTRIYLEEKDKDFKLLCYRQSRLIVEVVFKSRVGSLIHTWLRCMSLRFTSGVTPTNFLAAGIAGEPISSTYLRAGICGGSCGFWDK